MRDGPAPAWFNHLIPALVIAGLVLVAVLLAGCVTVEGCGGYIEQGTTGVRCAWTHFGSAP